LFVVFDQSKTAVLAYLPQEREQNNKRSPHDQIDYQVLGYALEALYYETGRVTVVELASRIVYDNKIGGVRRSGGRGRENTRRRISHL
jgi:hypothetical protein